MSKLTVLKEHLASLQMLYNDKHLGKRNHEQSIALNDIKLLSGTIMVLQNQKIELKTNHSVENISKPKYIEGVGEVIETKKAHISNIKVHFEEVKPDSKSILTKLFKSLISSLSVP